MKILLDQNLDRRLKDHFPEYETATTQEQGWSDVLNGQLLTLAEENDFDVMLTADANIKAQQNMTNRTIAILVFRAFNNRLKTHIEMIEAAKSVLLHIGKGEIIEIFHQDFKAKSK